MLANSNRTVPSTRGTSVADSVSPANVQTSAPSSASARCAAAMSLLTAG
eukprot:CAMPEP_0174870338 /NCGR_PEP_ID=MMETSP1114-20130205/69557_1 /TAXON_ID=312471 /ORGANISM="Neobodo designis, Strain CCAP 1951/1" /LENGTH=48 /DNA_ID= /DNA_START= /DNA_END= /DNA_ORIENTATION=